MRPTKGEINFRRAFLDSVPREDALKAIIKHLQRMNRCKHFNRYVTPRDWYAAPFR